MNDNCILIVQRRLLCRYASLLVGKSIHQITMSRMSIRKSTRHSLIDDSKINLDDQDPPPIIGDSIQPNDAWVQVYQKMIDSGWNWFVGSGLSDFHYLKPGISEVKGNI